jgi:hypothetical protein
MYSCAIHDKFPFICFRWSCIAAELKLPHFDTTGMKKQMKARSSLRKKKRQRAKNKRLREKGIAVPDNNPIVSGETPVKKDSLKYRFAALSEDRYIIISFDKKEPIKTDSIFVRYNNDEDDVLDYDKQIIRSYLDSNKVDNITLIKVREHFGDKKEDEQQNKHTSITKEHIAMFLMKFGIPRERIKLTNRK